MPIASYLDEYGTYYKLFIHEVDIVSVAPNATVSFSSIYTLPLLILTVAVILINFYISMSIFRAVKLQQFIKLFKLSRISVAILVVLIVVFLLLYNSSLLTPHFFKDFHISEFFPVDGEAHHRDLFVES